MTRARRSVDATVDRAAQLHAGIEKHQSKHGMVIANPWVTGDDGDEHEYFIHATGLVDELRRDDAAAFEPGKPTIVALDAPLVHVTSETHRLKKGGRVAHVGVGSHASF